MKKISYTLIGILLLCTTVSCFKDKDDEVIAASDLEIQNFIYRAMNIWYLYKPDVPPLADDYFNTQDELDSYLNGFDTPEDLFYNGLLSNNVDRFSFITDDYRELENTFAGVSKNNGMDYGLSLYPNNSSLAFGFVRLVLPGTSAEDSGVTRGMLFNTIDGENIGTVATSGGRSLDSRAVELLGQDSYKIGLATLDTNGDIVSTGETITLTKSEYTENPIYIAKTLDVGNEKVGYLMYNSFTSNFDGELNDAFAQFKADGVTDLVLDLRYNGGGSVRTATDLAAMITGQFAGEIFSTEVWNPQIQAAFEAEEPENLNNRFNTKTSTSADINSLNLNRVYILTTGSSASASELVINGLDPYIDVIQIGTTTVGKFQASTTFYDSEAPNFARDGANPNHFYAIQPLILTSANANGVTGFVNGLDPDIEVQERISNYGILGDPDEPLLAAALDDIDPNRSFDTVKKEEKLGPPIELVGENGMTSPAYQRMYVDLKK